MATKSSSGAGGAIITAISIIAGGYLTLKLFQNVTAANAASNQQNQNFLSKLLKSLTGSKGGSSGSPNSGGGAAGQFGLGQVKQALADGNALLSQYLDNSGLSSGTDALIPDASTGSAWDVLGNDFGLDPSVFNPIPTQDSPVDAGIPTQSVQNFDFAGFDPSSFGGGGGDGGDGGGDGGFGDGTESYAPEDMSDF